MYYWNIFATREFGLEENLKWIDGLFIVQMPRFLKETHSERKNFTNYC